MRILKTILVLAVCCKQVSSFPDGAPWDTCLTMFPKHGPQRQESECPFNVILNDTFYNPLDILSLNIQSVNSGQTFKGLQIRARRKTGDTEQIVGEFISWPDDKMKALDCLGGVTNVVTHRNNEPVESVELAWRAPSMVVGDVEFVVTFVLDFNTYWMDVTFDLPSLLAPPIIVQPEPVLTNFEVIDWSECGESKGCFLYPRTCNGHDCYAAVTYRTVNQTVQFEMFGSKEGYISVGFSEDKSMGEEETIGCTVQDGHIGIQRGFNHKEKYNERQYKAGLTGIQATYADERMYCRFSRPLAMSVFVTEGHKETKTHDLSTEHYLFLAWGPVYKGTEVTYIHVELPPITDEKVNFQDTRIVRGSSLPISKQLHATFMLIAWIFLVGMTTVVARHYKDGFGEKMMCGTKLWFQVHRGLSAAAWLLTAAGFILIFVHVGKFTKNAKAHGALGITVMAACTLQALAGILRPGPDSSHRPVFNWGHYLLGKATQITAGVTLFFGFGVQMVPQPQRTFAYIVLGVAVGVQVFWDIVFDVERFLRKRKAKESYELKQPNGKSSDYVTDAGGQPASGLLLLLYVVCLMSLSSAALVSVYLF